MAFKRIVRVTSGDVTVSDHAIDFKATKYAGAAANTCTINIYNPSKDTISKMGIKGNTVVLEAGYEDERVTGVFFGTVGDYMMEIQRTDRVLTLIINDGLKNRKETKASLAFPPNTKASAILSRIIAVLGYPIAGTLPQLTHNYVNGWSFSGFMHVALAQILKTESYLWSIQNEQLHIYKEGVPVVTTGLKLTPTTGLLNVSRIAEKKGKNEPGSNKPYYNIETLLFPEITPNYQMIVISDVLNGQVLVEEAEYSGSNYSGEFKCVAKVVVL